MLACQHPQDVICELEGSIIIRLWYQKQQNTLGCLQVAPKPFKSYGVRMRMYFFSEDTVLICAGRDHKEMFAQKPWERYIRIYSHNSSRMKSLTPHLYYKLMGCFGSWVTLVMATHDESTHGLWIGGYPTRWSLATTRVIPILVNHGLINHGLPY